MITGRKPKPKPVGGPNGGLPRCPAHLDGAARKEWRRLAKPLYDCGILTVADRAAFAAYCQAYSRWVEAETKLKTTPMLIKTATGYIQHSPWLSISNKQLELMGRYMSELGLTPSARTRLADVLEETAKEPMIFNIVYETVDGQMLDADGNVVEHDPTAVNLNSRV